MSARQIRKLLSPLILQHQACEKIANMSAHVPVAAQRPAVVIDASARRSLPF